MSIFSTSEKSEFQKNRDALKSCKRIDFIMCIAYFVMCFPVVAESFFRGFVFGLETLILLFFGILANIAVFFLGYWGCYRKNITYSMAASLVALVSGIVCVALDTAFGDALMFISTSTIGLSNLATAMFSGLLIQLNIYNIKRYNYLEEQPGFPYFNDLIEKQKEERRQFEIKSEYEKTYERMSNNKVQRISENNYRYITDISKPTQMDEI